MISRDEASARAPRASRSAERARGRGAASSASGGGAPRASKKRDSDMNVFSPNNGLRPRTSQVRARAARRRAGVCLHGREPRDARGDLHALSARAPQVGDPLRAVHRAAAAGLPHAERDAARGRSSSAARPPTSRTSCRTTSCSSRGRPASTCCRSAARCRARCMGAERVTEELSQRARHQARRDRRGARVHAARSRVPGRLRQGAGRRRQRRLARVPAPRGRARARSTAFARTALRSLTGCHLAVEKK